MKKEGVHIYISNRGLYTLVALLVLAIFSVGVYAVSHPNPGHPASEIIESDSQVKTFAKVGNPLGSCGPGSSIRVINDDGTVTCQSDDSGSDYCSGGTCGDLTLSNRLTLNSVNSGGGVQLFVTRDPANSVSLCGDFGGVNIHKFGIVSLCAKLV